MARKIFTDKEKEILSRKPKNLDESLRNAQDLLDEKNGKPEVKMIKDMDWRIFQDKNRIKVLKERQEELLAEHTAYHEMVKAKAEYTAAKEKLARALLQDADYNEVMESLADERLTLKDDKDILSLHVVEYYAKTHEHQVELGDKGEARDIIVTGRLGNSGNYQTNLFSSKE